MNICTGYHIEVRNSKLVKLMKQELRKDNKINTGQWQIKNAEMDTNFEKLFVRHSVTKTLVFVIMHQVTCYTFQIKQHQLYDKYHYLSLLHVIIIIP